MAEQSIWQRLVAAVNREYDRRIRRASLVTEYGAPHHHADHNHHEGSHAGHDEDHASADEEGAAEIRNVPKGTPLGRHARPIPPVETDTAP